MRLAVDQRQPPSLVVAIIAPTMHDECWQATERESEDNGFLLARYCVLRGGVELYEREGRKEEKREEGHCRLL